MTISSQQQFNAHADKYASSLVHRAGPSLPVLLEFAAPSRGDVALDVATGTGNTALALAPFVSRVTGIDLAAKMLENARTRALEERIGNADFLEGSAEALPFPDASFDLVTSRHAPHHFRDVSRFLSEVARVLKPGGRFVMADQVTLEAQNQTWVDEYQRTRDPSHFAQRTPQTWKDLTRAAGLHWTQDTIVPYRLEFDWWTQQSGCTPERLERIRAMLETAPDEIRLERNPDGSPLAHHEPMLVVRLEKPASS
jgi:ubiquinone/menaquinone biosynthesis C-methylase UbiE